MISKRSTAASRATSPDLPASRTQADLGAASPAIPVVWLVQRHLGGVASLDYTDESSCRRGIFAIQARSASKSATDMSALPSRTKE